MLHGSWRSLFLTESRDRTKMKLHIKKQKPSISERHRPRSEPSPKVFSYYAHGSSDNSQNTGRSDQAIGQKKPRSYKKFAYLPSYLALCMIVVAGIYSLWLQPMPKVVLINKDGTVYHSVQDYQIGISSIWHRSILNQTKLTIHGAAIKSDILNQYGELSDVRIEMPLLGRRATVFLTPDYPALQFVNINGAFYVNVNGKVMSKIAEVTQNHLQNVPVIHDETGIKAEVGKNIIAQTQAEFLHKLSSQLTVEGIITESITLPATAANEADVRIKGQSYYIKFSMLNDPRQAVGAYQTVKAKLGQDHAQPKEYIDVRVDEKVFYK